MGGQRHAPTATPQGKTLGAAVQGVGWAQGGFGGCGESRSPPPRGMMMITIMMMIIIIKQNRYQDNQHKHYSIINLVLWHYIVVANSLERIVTAIMTKPSGVPRGWVWGVQTPPTPNSEGPPKSCQTQPHCENCQKPLKLGRQHSKMFGKKAVKF